MHASLVLLSCGLALAGRVPSTNGAFATAPPRGASCLATPTRSRALLPVRAGPPAVELAGDGATAAAFPPPLTGFAQTKRGLEFYKRVLPVLAAYKAKEFELNFRRTVRNEVISAAEEEAMWRAVDDWGSDVVAATINELQGFYVKTGQLISTRVDLFPAAYTEKLQDLQDSLDPMPFDLVREVVSQELLDGAPLSELFATFEPDPLGCASIAQVHAATLLDGRKVAVKLQRPNAESKLLGDVANLKRISKLLSDALPLDYYTVFCELELSLFGELDFLAEAQAMRKIDFAVTHDAAGAPCGARPVGVPLPVGELVSKRVLVMDFVEGVPLNKLETVLKERGIEPGSPEAKLAGRKILDSLSIAFGRMIFGSGFIHGDPHPGNIFIGEGGSVSLIDCGQCKALPRPQRVALAEVVLAVDEYQATRAEGGPPHAAANARLAGLVRDFGVRFFEGKNEDDDLASSVALFLFGDADAALPGGYSNNELSGDSPIKAVAFFPQELVLMGRATLLLKGISKRLDVPFDLAQRWAPGCLLTTEVAAEPILPLWGREVVDAMGGGGACEPSASGGGGASKLKFRQVYRLLKKWGKEKGGRAAERVVKRLPRSLRNRLLEKIVERQELNDSAAKRH